MYCTQCGNAVSNGDKFCSKCGSVIPGPVADHVTIAPAQKDSPLVTSASQPSLAEVSLAADPEFLKSFAKSLAVSVWWKTSLALFIPGLILVASEMINPGTANVSLFLSLTVILYLLATAYVPYQSLRSLIGKSITRVEAAKGFAVHVGSVELHPSPVTNNDYIALTWGFVWRLTVVSVLLALPFQLSGYAPDDLERLLVSLVMLMLACWLASLWLVFAPHGRCRFHTVLSKSE
jgi:hypothetical protein